MSNSPDPAEAIARLVMVPPMASICVLLAQHEMNYLSCITRRTFNIMINVLLIMLSNTTAVRAMSTTAIMVNNSSVQQVFTYKVMEYVNNLHSNTSNINGYADASQNKLIFTCFDGVCCTSTCCSHALLRTSGSTRLLSMAQITLFYSIPTSSSPALASSAIPSHANALSQLCTARCTTWRRSSCSSPSPSSSLLLQQTTSFDLLSLSFIHKSLAVRSFAAPSGDNGHMYICTAMTTCMYVRSSSTPGGGIFRRFFERGSSLDCQVSGNPKETFSISTQPEKIAAEVSLQALVPLPPMSPPHSPPPLPFSTILFGDCSARMRAIARTRDLLHHELYFIENGCSSGEHHMCMCSSSYYCYYLLVRYVCSEDDITSCHITCTCTCTCIPLAFLAPPTPCTPAHAHHSLIRALAHEHLPQVQCRAREVGSVDEGFQVSLLLRIDHMKSHINLCYRARVHVCIRSF